MRACCVAGTERMQPAAQGDAISRRAKKEGDSDPPCVDVGLPPPLEKKEGVL
jgi:hypothetical protein